MNHLQNTVSKYLLQHVQNPVDWYPWGEAPFHRAKEENKPVLVSIGYAACHWCHVMEKESFEDPEVAEIMNRYFICIKIDREEHPDVDHFYMDALQSLSGNGGWPLNMFVTPEKKPFYGGTYFPPKPMQGRNSWKGILIAIANAWKEQPEEIARQSEQMMQHLKQIATVGAGTDETTSFRVGDAKEICRNLWENADKKWGGFGTAPKFPSSFSIQYFLDFYQLQQQQHDVNEWGEMALEQALLTLDKMLYGGIYDQAGGGFFRYAVDGQWQIPHFEKMLYDNALMISLLAVACRVAGKKHYYRCLRETVDFCNRELRMENQPGFYCSLDADADGEEGRFYTWTTKEWQQALPIPHPAITAYFGMEGELDSSPEHPLLCALSDEQVMTQFGLSVSEWASILAKAKGRLRATREKRTRPEVDDKQLLSWNALMNKALQDAAMVLKDESLMKQAEEHLRWMETTFLSIDGHWQHACKENKAYIEANLDDYAFLIRSMISFASCSGKNDWLEKAAYTINEITPLFQATGESSYFYFSTSKQEGVPLRKIEIYDGAQPSSNAVMAENLFLLGECYGNKEWVGRAEQMLGGVLQTTKRYARSFSYWALLIQRMAAKPKTLVIAAEAPQMILKETCSDYYPGLFILCSDKQKEVIPILKEKFTTGGQQFYLCFDRQCLQPVENWTEIKTLIKKIR